jgi:hypothetical protein
MSDDLGLMSFKDGEPANAISSELILKILGPFIRPIHDPRYDERWELVFPDGGGGEMGPVILGEDEDLSINRPSGGQLYDAIYEIMSQTHTLMFVTGMEDMITADPNIADHLPPDYIEEFGVPPLVHSGADIIAEILKT